MDFIHIKSLDKYHPGYKDRTLQWAKIYFNLVQGDPEFELIESEIDKWRYVAMVLLELKAQTPLPNIDRYWKSKGFNLKKRSMSLTLKMLHNFINTVTEDSELQYVDKDKDKDKDKDRQRKYGEYNHVLLTDKQFKDLKGKVDNREKWIKIMDEAIEEKGNIWHIKNFYLAILKWYKKDNPEKTNNKKIYHWICPKGCEADKGFKTDMDDCLSYCDVCKEERIRT